MKTKIQIKDLNTELMNLYYQDGNMDMKELELFDTQVKYDKETGIEIGVEDVLNLPVEGVNDIDEVTFDLEDYRVNHRVSTSKFKDRGLYWSSEEQALVLYRDFKGTESITSAAVFGVETNVEYEKDFDDQLEVNINYEHNDFITDAQKDLNFNFFMGRVAQANNFRKLKIVRESVLAGQKGSWFFMKKEDAKKFWDAYNQKKAYLNKVKVSK